MTWEARPVPGPNVAGGDEAKEGGGMAVPPAPSLSVAPTGRADRPRHMRSRDGGPRHTAARHRSGAVGQDDPGPVEGPLVARLWATARFPLTVWALWRVAHLVLVIAFGGDPVDATFHFDGGWFRTILDHGYVVTDPAYDTAQNPAFMPGIAWLAWPLAQVIGAEAAALTVANLTGAGAFWAVYGATRSWSGERAARIATIGLALWPTSLVLWAYYSEGLFIVATGLGLWAERRDRPAAALAGCFLVPLTRTVGLAFGPVMAVGRWWRLRRIDAVGVFYAVAGLSATATVSLVQQVQVDDPLAWMHAQEPWGRGLSFPWSPLVTAVGDVIDKLPHPAMELSINLASVLLVLVGVCVLVRWWLRDRLPLSVAGWAAAGWLVPLCSTVVSSQVRFALGAWPALVAWADDSRWGRPARIAGGAAGLVLSVIFLRRWATNTWVA